MTPQDRKITRATLHMMIHPLTFGESGDVQEGDFGAELHIFHQNLAERKAKLGLTFIVMPQIIFKKPRKSHHSTGSSSKDQQGSHPRAKCLQLVARA